MATVKHTALRGLDLDVAAIILGGWEATPPGGAAPGFGATGDLFAGGDAEIVRLWRAHEPYLRALAAAWGWSPSWDLDGRQLFFGEYLLKGGQ